MPLSPDHNEKKAAVNEAEKIIRKHRKFSRLTDFYTNHQELVNYTTTMLSTLAIFMGSTALIQDAQIQTVSLLSAEYAQNISRFKHMNVSLSGFGSLYAGEFIYNTFIKRKFTS